MAATYLSEVDFAVAQLSSNDSIWNVALHVSQRLQTVGGWTCRGSSINGSAGTAFSATPDNVDRWAGKTRAQATDMTVPIWMVLEHPVSLLQICLEVQPGFIRLNCVVAKNAFEEFGGWRNFPVAAGTRPADTTSLPASDREVATSTFPSPSAPSGTQYYNILIRDDGRGFVFWYNRQNATTADDQTFVWGFLPFSQPHASDTNPYCSFYIQGSNLATGIMTNDPNGIVAATRQLRTRLEDGTVANNAMLDVNNGAASLIPTGMQTPDPWTGLRLAWPVVLWTNASGNTFRFCLEDVFLADAALPSFETRNDLSKLQIGRFLLPWDGVTVKGSDVDMTLVTINGEEPAPSGLGGDPKLFNRGMEVL